MTVSTRRGLLLVFPVVVAAALAAALIAVSVVAARSLRARDAAVRDGLLARTGHELEGLLRENGAGGSEAVLREFGTAHRDLLQGIAVTGRSGVVSAWGVLAAVPFEMPAMLGPGWRGLGGGGMGTGRSPFTLRLHPAPGVGTDVPLATILVAGSVVAAAGLLLSSILAARGLAERARRDRLEAEKQRLDALALAGAGLAHRIRNPLAAIKGTAQLMASQPEAPVSERVARILEASARIEELALQLLRFARPPDPRPEVFDLAALACDAARRAGAGAPAVTPAPVLVRADAGHAEDVLDELLANARAHDASGPLEVAPGRAPGVGFVEVRDRGPGLSVSPEEAFAPFVTSRAGGTGLGLPTVRALARASGGDVTLAPREGGGCVARLALPSAEG